jgi:serine/threonine-protein kinase
VNLTGRTLGDFVLEKKLGAGGMGEVYKARQVSLDRIVAVKILPKSLSHNEGFEERFRREARSAANLIHPNVIQVYHIGIDQELGTPYFAMEFVEGEDLQQRMRRIGRPPFEQTVELLAGVTSALACAYEKGIVHRDIKPSNIMIDRNEIVKVMDFGLAKATQDKQSSNLTQSGLIMGTPNYISPEAGRGDPIDTRSDIYSLGVVMYEMLTGQLPFTAGTPAAIIYKHVYEEPKPLRSVQDDVPPFLEEVCLRMMAKDPKDRYPNPKALLADLNEFKRNPAHYMQGGQRRTPVIGSGSLTGDQTLTASGSYPGRAGPGSRTNEQTQTFREGQTHPDAETLVGSPQTGAMVGSSGQLRTGAYTQAGQAPPPSSSKLVPVLVGLLVVTMAVAGYFMAPTLLGTGGGTTGPTGPTVGPVAGKAILAASKLEPIVKKIDGVQVAVLVGFDEKKLAFADIPVDPGEYVLVFKKKHFEDIRKTIRVTREGTSPPLESIELKLEPSEEAKKALEAAQRAFDDQRFKEVTSMLQSLVENAPDYEAAATLYGKASVRYKQIREQFNTGQRHYNSKRWAEAIKAWADVPPTFDDYNLARSMSEAADGHLKALKQNRENFEKYFALGQYSDAATCLAEIDTRLPPEDTTVRGFRDRLKKAADDLEAGRRELEGGNLQEAVKHLESLLTASPSHAEGAKLLDKARSELAKRMGDAETLQLALKNGEKAFQEGQYEVAVNEARRGLLADKGSAAAKDLLERAQRKIVEGQVTRRFAEMDELFKSLSVGSREKRSFALVQMMDPGAPGAAAFKADVDLFAATPVRVDESTHRDFAFELKGGAEASEVVVECSWDVTLAFPETAGATPPARGQTTALSVRQRVRWKRAGEVWLITSFEEVGKANVR